MRILHADLETFPVHAVVWGLWGQNVSINQIRKPGTTACAAMKWDGEPAKNMTFVSAWEDGFEEMIKTLHEYLSVADVVVTYNGNKFDLPTLNREFVLQGLPPPDHYQSIDLYRVVKRSFKFDSAKLDFVCQQMGLGSKTHHKGMDLWTDVEKGCPKAQRVMKTYNKQDVVLLEKLYHRLRPWIKNHPTRDLGVEFACPVCGSHNIQKRGTYPTKTNLYHRFRCNDCLSPGRARISEKLDNKNLIISL